MTLQQIHYALVVAETGSMNRAAEKLYVTQPALTTAIQELEAEIHTPIFHRTNRGVSLTSEGTRFLRYARQVYQQYELLEREYGTTRTVKRVFGVSTQHYSFVTKAFVETVKRYDASHFDFAIRETRTIDVIRDVAQQRSNLGILFRSEHNKKVLSRMFAEHRLEFNKLIDCRAYVYLWKGHPLAQETSISMEQLKHYHSSSYLSEELFSELEYPQAIHATDRATMLNLMIGLNGYTLCSGMICEELNGSDHVAVPYQEDREHQNARMEIGYLVRKDSPLDEVGETFLQEIRRYLDQQEQSPLCDPSDFAL
jgi:DNA-binding transcriptional LysR family regulator